MSILESIICIFLIYGFLKLVSFILRVSFNVAIVILIIAMLIFKNII